MAITALTPALRAIACASLCALIASLLGCQSQVEPLDARAATAAPVPKTARAVMQEPQARTHEGKGVNLGDGLDAEEAVLIAIETNLELRAYRREREVAEAGVTTASAIPNPTVRGELLHLQKPSSLGWGASLQWTPPQPVERDARRAQAKARVEEVRQDILEREWELSAEVRLAHAMASEYQEQLIPVKRAIELRKGLVEAIRLRVSQGASTQFELSLALTSLARAEQEQENLRLSQDAAVRALVSLMGVVPDKTIKLQEHDAASWPADDARIPEPEEMAQRAFAVRPLLRMTAARHEQYAQLLRAEQTKRWPWITAITLPRFRHNDTSFYPNDFGVSVDVSIPVFDQNRGPIEAADAARRREHDTFLATVTSIRKNVVLACAELEARRISINRYRESILPSLDEQERILQTVFESRQTDMAALLATQDAALRIRREYVDARLAYRKAWVDLARIVGARPSSLVRSTP